ncbi:ribosome biogenesis protein Bms1 [Histomonas meleagridis]|uniref:ribosome biogenesis protein Bms1 n=1 Tax=Histomonas meleagridis TaxID=135588 RepID=UPI003559744E|nr:ribosome biogenesis protein Bms1 [Histomonas meleagridis]KAH0797260.1 ribosome biogenesis protein Bms1 [Histomonas meleagridis]
MEEQTNKPHQAPHKRQKTIDLHNIRAFGYTKGERARKAIAHQLNIEQIRLFQPETKQYKVEDPPIVIAVQGPPGCGKSLLIRCLVKRYTGQNVMTVRGPITVIANRAQRITFIEVPNDINAMTDAAKIADIVLLMVNASHNFEMETFEFLNLLSSHGFPKIISVISHLDLCDKSAASAIKARFRKELSTTVKVYKLEKLIHGKYEKKSIMGLSRLLNQSKIRVLSFRKGRGYLIADRVESGKNGETLLFGYCRGDGLNNKQRIHIPGAGDYTIDNIQILDDPCPLSNPKETSQRQIQQKTQRIHAPMSDIGGLKIDDDAIYVDIPRNQLDFTKLTSPSVNLTEEEIKALESEAVETRGVKMVRELQEKPTVVPNERQKIALFDGVYVSDNEDEEEANEQPPEPKEKVLEEDVNEYDEEENVNEAEEDVNENDGEDPIYEDGEERVQPQGEVPPGKYIRVSFVDIPPAFVERFDPKNPVVIGGLFPEEYEKESVQQWVKIKRHRFYARKPKSSDPMIVSIGWRRYQAIPIYFNEERDGKLKFLKYMPDFLTCYATFFGPNSAINVGVTAFQHIKEKLDSFRISATGVTIKEMGDGYVVKKLRVKGHPKEIFKRTAMIENMFTSDVEATPFVGALIRTVSGIRGVIKKVEKNGVVRCTFEDKIKKSDIVFLNTWVKVHPTEFFQPVNSLLSDSWGLVRTTAELRSYLNLRPEYNEDSVYRDVDRPEIKKPSMRIPKSINEQLPYKIKKQNEKKETKKASVMNEDEADLLAMISKTTKLYEAKKAQREKAKQEEEQLLKKQAEAEEAEKMHKRTLRKKEFFKRNPRMAHR